VPPRGSRQGVTPRAAQRALSRNLKRKHGGSAGQDLSPISQQILRTDAGSAKRSSAHEYSLGPSPTVGAPGEVRWSFLKARILVPRVAILGCLNLFKSCSSSSWQFGRRLLVCTPAEISPPHLRKGGNGLAGLDWLPETVLGYGWAAIDCDSTSPSGG
jgi:hypothetical protein